MSVANIILNQLGGSRKLSMMIGAKNFIDHGDGLSFRFPRPSKGKPNYLKITLNKSTDTYDLKFGSIHGYKFKVLKEMDGVYFDQLADIFEKTTGLYLTLHRRR